jgi:hypothetical protein
MTIHSYDRIVFSKWHFRQKIYKDSYGIVSVLKKLRKKLVKTWDIKL